VPETSSHVSHGAKTALARRVLARPEHHLLIDAQARPAASGRSYELFDPSTGSSIGHAADGGGEDIERAVQVARREFEDGTWRHLAPSRRGRLISRLAALLEAAGDALVELEVVNAGKRVADAEGYDVARAIEHFEYFAGWPGKLSGETIPVGEKHLVYSLRQPVGVVGLIVPWNFPLMLAAWKVAPALAAGCTVVLKPAAETPLTALVLGECAGEAGLPPGVLNIVTGGAEAGAALAHHPDVDKISFTGSTAVGRKVVTASAGNLKRLSLELGGKNPLIVFADADLEAASAAATRAAFFHAGQACVSGSRLLIERPAFDAVVDAVVRHAKALRVGPGADRETEMGPLISSRHLARVRAYIDAGESDGATLVAGGGLPEGQSDGNYLQPTVFTSTDDRVPIVRDEIFGPVVVAQPFDSVDEAVRRANATTYGLTSGVFTSDAALAHRMARELRAGTVWVNTYMVGDSAVPTGGVKQSGYGRDRGRQALEGYLEDKMVWVGLENQRP
jgi:phenylacetaldehyde dehydrogenase